MQRHRADAVAGGAVEALIQVLAADVVDNVADGAVIGFGRY